MRHFCLLTSLMAALILVGCGDPYEKGMQAYNEARWKEAIAHFKKVMKSSGRQRATREMIAKAQFNQGKEAFEQKNWEEVIEYLAKVKSDNTHYTQAREMIGCTYFFMGKEAYERQDWTEARICLNIVRSHCSKYEEALALAAKVKEKLKGGT